MQSNRQITCPKCGQADAVRKVSAIVAEGTWTSETSGLGLGIGENSPDLIALVGVSTSRSGVATRLALPRKPAQPQGYGWAAVYGFGRLALVLFVGLILISGILISFPFLINTYSQNPTLILIPVVVIVGFLIAAVLWLVRSSVHDVQSRSKNHGNYEGKLRAWQRKASQWNELYYCARDDGVFTPEQKVLLPLNAYKSNQPAQIRS